jgi:hypothetical protein
MPIELVPKKPFYLVNTNLDGAIPPHEAEAEACYSETYVLNPLYELAI